MRMKSLLLSALLLVLPAAASASEGASSGGLLTVDGGLMFWTLIVFGLLLYILKKTAWPVILEAVEERERSLQQTLDEAARLAAQAKADLAKQEQLLREAGDKAAAMLADAKQAAERERTLAIDKARGEAEEILTRARREIGAEKERASAELRREAVDLALAAAGKLIGQRLEAAQDKKIVTDFLSTLESSK